MPEDGVFSCLPEGIPKSNQDLICREGDARTVLPMIPKTAAVKAPTALAVVLDFSFGCPASD